MSLSETILDAARYLESRLGDFLLDIETHGSVYFERSGVRRDYSDYETVSHLVIAAVLHCAGISTEDIVYVLGSGKGRAVAHLARMKLRKVVGIELSEELCRISRDNMERLKMRLSPVEIRNQDVIGADLDEATVFYMFNPFGPETMRTFLSKIDGSRPGVRIIYLNPLCRSVFEGFPRLKLVRTNKYPVGPAVNIYQFQ